MLILLFLATKIRSKLSRSNDRLLDKRLPRQLLLRAALAGPAQAGQRQVVGVQPGEPPRSTAGLAQNR